MDRMEGRISAELERLAGFRGLMEWGRRRLPVSGCWGTWAVK